MAGNVQKSKVGKTGTTFARNQFSVRGNNGKGFGSSKDYRVDGTFSRRR
jgi:hypothetical protein